jgi:RNA polymerase sigma-70 factor (ECF subfamily)
MRMTERTGNPLEGDAEAIERTLAGNRDAYRVLVERHSTSVFRLAYRLTGNRQDAEEVVQEAFLRAYQKLEQFEARANFGTWVYRIAANYSIDRMRQKRIEEARREEPSSRAHENAEKSLMNLVPDGRPSPERLAQNAELRNQLALALDELTQAERTAFVMRHWHGCGIEEIAAALNSNSGATKNTVFRAVQKLRNILTPLLGQAAGARAMGTK